MRVIIYSKTTSNKTKILIKKLNNFHQTNKIILGKAISILRMAKNEYIK